MANDIILSEVLFESKDVFGRSIRITKNYWSQIMTVKHQDLQVDEQTVINTIKQPDEVYQSVQDDFISLFYRDIPNTTLVLVVVVKYLNGNGFVVTIYQTSKSKRKGVRLWPK